MMSLESYKNRLILARTPCNLLTIFSKLNKIVLNKKIVIANLNIFSSLKRPPLAKKGAFHSGWLLYPKYRIGKQNEEKLKIKSLTSYSTSNWKMQILNGINSQKVFFPIPLSSTSNYIYRDPLLWFVRRIVHKGRIWPAVRPCKRQTLL